jgi:predicted nucleic acid-binding protein
MVVVIDANVLISACLNMQSTIASVIMQHSNTDFVIPSYLFKEFKKNVPRICNSLSLSTVLFNQNLTVLLQNIVTVNEDEISDEIFSEAYLLTKNIDEKDTPYVAMALALSALLWTGDMKLYRGLKRKDFQLAVTTSELKEILKGI